MDAPRRPPPRANRRGDQALTGAVR
jgi:hypothetical protein